VPIPDKIASANKINEFLRGVVTQGALHLKYRITVDPPLAEERDWERPEILVEFSGPDSALLLERGAELLRRDVEPFGDVVQERLSRVRAGTLGGGICATGARRHCQRCQDQDDVSLETAVQRALLRWPGAPSTVRPWAALFQAILREA